MSADECFLIHSMLIFTCENSPRMFEYENTVGSSNRTFEQYREIQLEAPLKTSTASYSCYL